jgi:Cytochrome c oxidase subunit IV
MTVALRLFFSSMGFGLVIGTAYWFSSHDATGTVLLCLMAAGLGFAAGYMLFAEREAALPGDQKNALPGDAAGAEVGVFTVHTPWPPCLAATIAAFLIGLLISPVIAIGAACAIVAVCWQLVRESR